MSPAAHTDPAQAESAQAESAHIPRPFRAAEVTRVVEGLLAPTKAASLQNWRRAVAATTAAKRPDLAHALAHILEAQPFEDGAGPLKNLTIGEISVCYEALIAALDADKRKASGQYFTPDDAARFMAGQSMSFPVGTWLDPCCGVGNLAWHLADTQDDSAAFVRHRLTLIDRDETALRSAVALIGADFVARGDEGGLEALHLRSHVRDFLHDSPLPAHDFVIVNPPYARATYRPDMKTGVTREVYAYFLERVATESSGFIAVTPASYLSARKFASLRAALDAEAAGGAVFVFDNVPDTLFRGYKFGSSNTSKTNFVRAAITVCAPGMHGWGVTPIIRWKAVSRQRMFRMAPTLLSPRLLGPSGEWAKIHPQLLELWGRLSASTTSLSDMIVPRETEFTLCVATTPRYYVSAAYRDLRRFSKVTLYFANEDERDRAALILNSSLPYLWWRGLDGGVTLPRRVLMSVPIPLRGPLSGAQKRLAQVLRDTEEGSLVTKLNAGNVNENVKRDPALVQELNEAVLGKVPDLRALYSEDMAAEGT